MLSMRKAALAAFLLLPLMAPIGSCGWADTQSESEILAKAVKELRRACLSQESAGRGIAEADAFQQSRKEGIKDVEGRTSRIEFAFSGRDSIWRESLKDDPNHTILTAAIVRGDRKIEYLNIIGRPRSVRVTKVTRNSLQILEPVEWSIRDLARLPLWEDDESFFGLLMRPDPEQFTWAARRDGTVVCITLNFAIPKEDPTGRTRQELTIEFDMAHGGMTRSFAFSGTSKERDGTLRDATERISTAWKEVDRNVVPVERTAEILVKRAGRITQQTRTTIRFTEFSVGKVEPSEFTLARFGVPDGTPVVDHMLGVDWKYTKGVDINDILPDATPPDQHGERK